ncbi:DUF2971 domain-containing protein [Rhodococcoides fascians]|uniref:DUF2971 domain-containing protein n=2 Tax=Rhodococcoides fascians TaxID=1828 RepID=UPI0018B00C86|nr:DUF2971 domain-containing protein [Rhodococcus fascians]
MAPPDAANSTREQDMSEFSPLEIPVNPPVELWHYTDAAGLLGILTNADHSVPSTDRTANTVVYRPVFHATMAEYLNDSREVLHGLEIVRGWMQVIPDRTSPSLDDKVRLFLSDLCNAIEQISNREYLALMHCHTVSFSERPDVLSQWRAYGGGTGGFAIGFDTRAFPYSDGSVMHRAGVGLHQVRYLEGDTLDGPLATAVDVFIDQVSRDSTRWPEKQTPSRVNRALRSLGIVAACIKHPGFKEEEEWRFIAPGFSGQVRFRAGSGGLVPYRTVGLGTEQCRPSDAVTGVVIGPGPLQYENKLATESMLQFHGYFAAANNVTCSSTPFR